MSLTCHEEMGVSDVSDEDATRMLGTCPQQVVRIGLVEFGERHDTRTNGQHYTPQQTARWQAEWESYPTRHARLLRSILVRMSGVSAMMSEDAVRKLLP